MLGRRSLAPRLRSAASLAPRPCGPHCYSLLLAASISLPFLCSSPAALRPPRPHLLLRTASVHPFSDAGELFLELLYQGLDEQLLAESALVGVELVTAAEQREQLMEKSGEAKALKGVLQQAAKAGGIEGARDAQRAFSRIVAGATSAGRLSAKEATEIQQLLGNSRTSCMIGALAFCILGREDTS